MARPPKNRQDPDHEKEKDQRRAERLKFLEQLLGITFLTLDELGEKLQINTVTLRRHIVSGKLPAYQPGRSYLISELDAYNYLESFRVAPRVAESSASYIWTEPPQAQQPTTDQSAFVTVDDLVLFLKRSRPFILKDIEEGCLAAWDLGEYRIPVQEALRYLESFKVEPETEEDK